MPGSRRVWLAALVTVAGGVLFAIAPSALANEPLPEGPASLQDFVRQSVPQWNFPRANRNDPCWPEPAFDGHGNPTDGGSVQAWPNSDGGCAPHGAPFPTYYTVQKCNPDEIRVSFTIYQATSGFWPSGHRHDFEHVDVVWRKNGNEWTRHRLLLSAHGKHRVVDWSRAESWNARRDHASLGLEHPRVFVGFGSHSMYNNQGGRKDVISAYTDEYRAADYRVWPDQGGGLVEVVKDGDLYRRFEVNASAWGSADSNPARVGKDACWH